MQNKVAADILDRYKQGICTEEEILILKKWFLDFEINSEVSFTETELLEAEAKMWTHIQSSITPVPARLIPLQKWKRYISAAAVLLLAGTAVFFGIRYQQTAQHTYVTLRTKDLNPGTSKAILIFSSGEKRNLSGTLYTAKPEAKDQEGIAYNTIMTPNGGQYQIILPDGTKVWLNASSSLKYPSSFRHQAQRSIVLTGEAYFEVAHDQEHPFLVKTAYQQVEVLGTHFNINSYADEEFTATTLLSGSVKISAKNGSKIMKPGEQTTLSGTGLVPELHSINPEIALAWKNGFFQFKRADLKTVMRQISRWYDVKVAYNDAVPKKEFTGKVYRNLKLSEALEVLSYFDVHFDVDGQKITITN